MGIARNHRAESAVTDSRVGTGLLLLGAALLAVAASRSPTALMFFPGLEGSVTTLVLAAVLLSIHGLRAKSLALLYVPLVGLQIISMQRTGFAWLGSVGLELAAMGAIALVFASFRRTAAPAHAGGPRKPRAGGANVAGFADGCVTEE